MNTCPFLYLFLSWGPSTPFGREGQAPGGRNRFFPVESGAKSFFPAEMTTGCSGFDEEEVIDYEGNGIKGPQQGKKCKYSQRQYIIEITTLIKRPKRRNDIKYEGKCYDHIL